jgi:small conductance mechanosensitive channel
VRNTLSVLLNVTLIVAILSFFGVETTTFAASIAGASVAIGAAWAGLLSNFAAGAFLVILRLFKAGDFISFGVAGSVEEVGLFVTTINTPDNVGTFVGNSKLLTDNISNCTANPFGRVDLTAPVAHAHDVERVMAELRTRLSQIPNVQATPAPDVKILSYAAFGCVLAVRPCVHNDHYWQVYFDTTEVIRQVLGTAGFPPPEVEINAA